MKTIQLPNQEKVYRLFDRSNIEYAALFGSRAKSKAKKDSDYDILIEFSPNKKYSLNDLVALKRTLEENINAGVDLVTTRGLNPKMEKEIRNSAQVIYDQRKR